MEASRLAEARTNTQRARDALQRLINRGFPYYPQSMGWFGSYEAVDRRQAEYKQNLRCLEADLEDALKEECAAQEALRLKEKSPETQGKCRRRIT